MGYVEIVSEASGYWPLQELSGTTAVDASGNGHDGVLTSLDFASDSIAGPTNWLPNALYKSASNTTGKITVNDHVDLRGGGQVSLSAWLTVDESGTLFPIGKGVDSNRKDYVLLRNTNGIGFLAEVNNSGYAVYSTSPGSGWVHLAATYDNSSGETNVFINGLLVATDTDAGESDNSTAALSMFALGYQGATNYSGALAGVGMWNRLLTEVEIRHLYVGPIPDDESTIGIVNVEGNVTGQVTVAGAESGIFHT